MTQETNNLAADLWALADLLRGDFKQSQYGRVILPFALLRRLECVLESSKSAVLMVIVEHFKDNVMGLLGGQAKAMVVTSSRKEAVRYKQCFDKYITEKGYQKIRAMVAFSGEVLFTDKDPNAEGLIGEKFTESNMNPNLKGRDMRKAFDSDDYQVMIVANKFQTGFDQPKLCDMYVDKKLAGVECVQTLSRLNRTYPNKAETGTIRDKVGENIKVMKQIENNSAEQALLGDFSKAIDDAILDSSDAHQNQMMQLLADPSKAANFARIVFDLLVQGQAGNR